FCSFCILSAPSIETLSLHDALPIFFNLVAVQHLDVHHGLHLKQKFISGSFCGISGTAFFGSEHRKFHICTNQYFCNCLCDSFGRSEEHTSELQSRENLVCRLLLEKK